MGIPDLRRTAQCVLPAWMAEADVSAGCEGSREDAGVQGDERDEFIRTGVEDSDAYVLAAAPLRAQAAPPEERARLSPNALRVVGPQRLLGNMLKSAHRAISNFEHIFRAWRAQNTRLSGSGLADGQQRFTRSARMRCLCFAADSDPRISC